MSGTVINVIAPTRYAVTVGAVAQTIEVPIATRVDASQFREAQVIVRLHGSTYTKPAGGILLVKTYMDTSTDWDPATPTKTNATSSSTDITNASPGGDSTIGTLSANFGPALLFTLSMQNGATAGSWVFVISIDLVLKN
jgi:hypothetical protein